MNSPHQREQLPALLCDALDAAERERVESHLAQCAQCARELRALQQTQNTLANLPVALTPGNLRSNVREALRAEKLQSPSQTSTSNSRTLTVLKSEDLSPRKADENKDWRDKDARKPRPNLALPFALPASSARRLAWGGAAVLSAIGLMLLARPSFQNGAYAPAPQSEAELAARSGVNSAANTTDAGQMDKAASRNAETAKSQPSRPGASKANAVKGQATQSQAAQAAPNAGRLPTFPPLPAPNARALESDGTPQVPAIPSAAPPSAPSRRSAPPVVTAIKPLPRIKIAPAPPTEIAPAKAVPSTKIAPKTNVPPVAKPSPMTLRAQSKASDDSAPQTASAPPLTLAAPLARARAAAPNAAAPNAAAPNAAAPSAAAPSAAAPSAAAPSAAAPSAAAPSAPANASNAGNAGNAPLQTPKSRLYAGRFGGANGEGATNSANNGDAPALPRSSAGERKNRSDTPRIRLAPGGAVSSAGASLGAAQQNSAGWTGGNVSATLTRLGAAKADVNGRARALPGASGAPLTLTFGVSLAIGNARLILLLPGGERRVWSGSLNALPVQIALPAATIEGASWKSGQKIRARLEQIGGDGNPMGSSTFELTLP